MRGNPPTSLEADKSLGIKLQRLVRVLDSKLRAEVGLPANPYQFVRRWLERRPQLTLRQVDPIIRQLTLYRDFIDHKTQENPSE